jgi:hypothetical protein
MKNFPRTPRSEKKQKCKNVNLKRKKEGKMQGKDPTW